LSFASYHQVLFHYVILTSLCSEVNIYLFLYPKEAFHILKKRKKKKEKDKCKTKKSRTDCELIRSAEKKSKVQLSDFTKPANLSDFTRAENWSDLACPFVPLGLVQFYQGCELVCFY
jgi:hypothetical protein